MQADPSAGGCRIFLNGGSVGPEIDEACVKDIFNSEMVHSNAYSAL